MSTIKNPVGPQPPSVYWRRRLLLALGLIAIVVIVVLIIVRPGSGGATPTGGQTSKTPSTPTDGFSSSATACDPSVITLTAVTDTASYAAGVQPQLSMSITNSGASACTFDVGTDAQVYTITSGSDTIWTSTDCQTDKAALKQVLQPGKTVSTTPFGWDRTRSSTTTCSATRPEVTAGGASYHLGVKLGDAKAKATKQFILQ